VTTRPSGHVARALLAISATLIFLIVAAIGADVASRAVFDTPLLGITELVSVAIPAILFLALPWLFSSNKLIRSDLLLRRLEQRSAAAADVLQSLFHAIGIFIGACIALPTAAAFSYAWRTHEFLGVEGSFMIPVWPAKFAIVLGSTLLCMYCTRALVELIVRRALASSRLHFAFYCCTLLVLAAALAANFGFTVENRGTAGVAAIAVMFALVYAGAPVAFALALAAALGIALIKQAPSIAFETLALVADSTVSDYIFAAVPLFVLMGLIVGAADIGRDSLQAAHWVLRRLRGGLGIATVAANALFAAITGISIASAAIFSRVAVPPLIEHGFSLRFSVGLVAGSSVLGMLIPPSLLLIVYGLIAEVSINRLFLAAVVPGLLLTAAFAAGVWTVAYLKPRFAVVDAAATATPPGFGGRTAVRKLIPVAVLIVLVLGGIYGGLFTPTEAGAIGAIAAAVIALLMRRIGIRALGGLLCEAAANSASILFLIVAASAFAIMLTLSGIPTALSTAITGADLTLTHYALAYLVAVIVLGMVLDSTSILLIMVPLALPTIHAFGGDPVWFGVISVVGVEIGLLTPPLGLSVYAIKASLADESVSLSDIFIGAMPFCLIMLGLTVALIFYPRLTQLL